MVSPSSVMMNGSVVSKPSRKYPAATPIETITKWMASPTAAVERVAFGGGGHTPRTICTHQKNFLAPQMIAKTEMEPRMGVTMNFIQGAIMGTTISVIGALPTPGRRELKGAR
jgi:hypothetical protein